MFDRIEKLLAEEYGIAGLSPDMNIKKDLGLNSFDLMNLMCIVEDEFGIELDEADFRHLSTVGEMCGHVEKLIGEK
jgi:acyl carrier protein